MANVGTYTSPGTNRSDQLVRRFVRFVDGMRIRKALEMAGKKMGTPPKFNSSPLQNGGWKTSFLLGRPIFRGEQLNFGRVNCVFFLHPYIRGVNFTLPKKIAGFLVPTKRTQIESQEICLSWSGTVISLKHRPYQLTL